MIVITFKPSRSEFNFLTESYNSVGDFVKAIKASLAAAGHRLMQIDHLSEDGCVVVWYPKGVQTSSNTFIGYANEPFPKGA